MSFLIRMICILAVIGAACTPVECRETLTLGVDDDFAPFSFSKEGRPAGIDVDIARELGRRIGVEFDIRLMPWKRLLTNLKKGQLDAGMSLFKTDERESYAIFTHPIHYSTFVLFVEKGREFNYTTVSDLYGKRIMIEAGFSVGDEFDRAVAARKIQIQEVFKSAGVFQFLIKGRYDAFVNNLEVTLYKLNNDSKLSKYASRITYLPRPVKARGGAYFVLSKQGRLKNKDALSRTIAGHLKAMEGEGLYSKITAAHLGRSD
ncbi:MAG: amino acid ABC transporter substrate-binding protein [Desulfobacter sp.]|nr:MAG: amino acid ABC transporter substrate-binding protein [Desulfobacter sp.]